MLKIFDERQKSFKFVRYEYFNNVGYLHLYIPTSNVKGPIKTEMLTITLFLQQIATSFNSKKHRWTFSLAQLPYKILAQTYLELRQVDIVQ